MTTPVGYWTGSINLDDGVFPTAVLGSLVHQLGGLAPDLYSALLPDGEVRVLLSAALKLVQSGGYLGNEDFKTFIDKVLPFCFQKIISDDPVHSFTPQALSGVFSCCNLFLELFCNFDYDRLSALKVLGLIFDPKLAFHEMLAGYTFTNPANSCAIIYARPPPSAVPGREKTLFAALLNKFGQHGGFEKLLARFQTQPPPSLAAVASLLRPFVCCIDFIDDGVVTKFLRPVAERAYRIIGSISDTDFTQLSLPTADREKPMSTALSCVRALLSHKAVTQEQQSNVSVLRRMYESGRFSDLAISVGGQTFRVHKAVLSAACPAILDLLLPGQDAIEVDSTPAAVGALLQHFYYDDRLSLAGNFDLSCEVLVLAEKWNLLQLKRDCETALGEQVSSLNALRLICVASKARAPDLKKFAFDFAATHINVLDTFGDWKALKTVYPLLAISLCERIIQGLSIASLPPRIQIPIRANVNQVPTAALLIPVRWEIPDFQNLIVNGNRGSFIDCKQPFTHESLPGLFWQLRIYPSGKGDSTQIGLFLRPVLTSNKKSQATAPFGGFSLRFETVSIVAGSTPPPEQTLPVQQFGLQSELGIAEFAPQNIVTQLCLTTNNSVVLRGNILVEPPPTSQRVSFRNRLESGRDADFTIKVEETSFSVHKLILSDGSKAMEAMLENNFKEVSNGEVEIKETTVEAVRALLQFWYGDPLCFDGLEDLSMEVYKLANRYQEYALRAMCEDALLRMVSRDNVVYLAAFAADQDCGALRELTSNTILHNAGVLLEDAWTQLKEQNLNLALTIAEGAVGRYRQTAG